MIDIYEKKAVYVKSTKKYGDSLFARRKIKRHELVAYYAGMIYDFAEANIFFPNQTMEEK